MRHVLLSTLLVLPSLSPAAERHCQVLLPASLPESLPVAEMAAPVSMVTVCSLVTAAEYSARVEQARAAAAAPVAAPLAPAPGTPATVSADGYVPKTAHDNSPWRFNMNQNGRRMTAEEFDAWMKAKGIRVATGKPGAAPAAEPAAAAPACQPSATITC